MDKTRVLVTGGSGYLGQFLVEGLAKDTDLQVLFTHHQSGAPQFKGAALPHKVDLATTEGLSGCFREPVDVVVNCAAVSQPVVCEKDPERVRRINVPSALVEALKKQQEQQQERRPALFIQISTDQVYSGERGGWSEEDECEPVNAYGESKLEAEAFLLESWPPSVILRSSNILGPPAVAQATEKKAFLQFVVDVLSSGEKATFFHDEWRSFVYAGDILEVVRSLVKLPHAPQHRVLNMGGPERLSRVHLARQVAKLCGFTESGIQAVSSSSINRGFRSPVDLSMRSERLTAVTGVQPRGLEAAVKHMRDTFHWP